jgi:hypothetical protein
MENDGWFKRGQDPKNSRFWKLIHGEKAKMFGVFNAYEQQVIYDWIAADADRSDFDPESAAALQCDLRRSKAETALRDACKYAQRRRLRRRSARLERSLAKAPDASRNVQKLIALMSPALHHTAQALKRRSFSPKSWAELQASERRLRV